MGKTIEIAGRKIGEGSPVFLIAEAGVNHNGELETALRMIDLAADAGADAVKFQTFRADEMILPDVEKAPYQSRNTGTDSSQAEMLRALEIGRAFHEALIARCRERGIMFLSTPYDRPSLKLLVKLGVSAVKVSSTDADNVLFLADIAACRLPVILSTGMADEAEILRAYNLFRDRGCADICLLKCTSDYPADPAAANLRGMAAIARLCPDAVAGFSDHSRGAGVSALAAAAGASVIEKHFTLDRAMSGPDHKASMNPEELRAWVKAVRDCERVMGNGVLRPADCELEGRARLRRFLVVARDMKKGETVTNDDLAFKRTGGRGISASKPETVIGRKLKADISRDTPLEERHLL